MVKGKRRVKRKIRFKQSAKLVHKNDATRVDRPEFVGLKRAPIRLSGDNGANFKIKIRRKQ